MKLKYFAFILIGLFIGFVLCYSLFANKNLTPTDLTDFSQENDHIRISGIMDYKGNDISLRQYTKSIILFCNLLNSKCTYVDATYVYNGNKLRPSLYPNWHECDIINKQYQKFILSCNNAYTGIIDIAGKNLTFTYDRATFTLNW